jgi:hypothetical protein
MKWKFASAATVAIVLIVTPRVALANFESFVAATGSDANPCTPSQPCASLQHAHDQTSAGGTIEIMSPGAYGQVLITKSINIISQTGGSNFEGGGNIFGTPIFTVNAGSSDTVMIRGFNFLSLSFIGIPNTSGIIFNSGGRLHLHNCIFANLNPGSGQGGLRFAPSGASKLVITDSVFSNNITGTSGSGILIQPTGSGSAQVDIERVTVEGNGFGIVADGSGSTTGINMIIADSTLTGNRNDGMIATTSSGGAPIGVTIKNTRSTVNGFGLRSIGSGVTIRVKNSEIIGNDTGLTAQGGGALLTNGDNTVQANGINGSFTGTLPAN